MKHRARIFALVLAFCLIVSLFPAAFADEGEDTVEDKSDFSEQITDEPESSDDDENEAENGGDDNSGDSESDADSADDAAPLSGVCGEALTWTLDKDGFLSISGTGAMKDYTHAEQPEWCSLNVLKAEIGSGVTSIGSYAFFECSGLTSITICEGVTSIGDLAFNNCKSLAGISLPDTVTSLGVSTFAGCEGLASINIPEGVESIGLGTFNSCMSLTSITIPDTVKSIDSYAFNRCSGLTSIAIPEGVTSIGNGTFSGCSSLASVSLPDSLTSIGNSAFAYCSSLKEITLPQSLTFIDDCAFDSCALTSITIPGSVSNVSSYAFIRCSALTEVIAAPENENYSSVDGVLFNKDKSALLIYPSGKQEAEYTVPAGVAVIGDGAFSRCTSLTGISLPEGVESIGGSCFAACSSLTSITIPSSLKSIGSSAFALCEGLKTIIFKGNAPTFEEDVFGGMSATGWTMATAYYPANDDTWTDEILQLFTGHITWVKASNNVELDSSEIAEGSSIWVDGIEYNYSDLVSADGKLCLELNGSSAKTITSYTYNTGDSAHTSYPTGMEVWLLSHDGTAYTAEHVTELDGLLRYAGSSIRISGNKGIRMISSIDQSLKASLLDGGVKGYQLVEYGTLLAWASEVPASSLVLGASGVSSNYAYLRGVADPVFAYKDNDMQYTNVITGFTLDQCIDDLVMRPYIKLSDCNNNEIVIYGGVVQRSIGYIAYQNRSAFDPGTNAYEYVWEIIHHVYADAYDAEYEG